MAAPKLTAKQLRFCEEYLIDSNGTLAAIRAGYATNSADVEASRLLRNAKVKTKLQELRKELTDSLGIDAQWVLKRFVDISNRCMQAEPVLIHDGEKWVESGEYKFDSSGANKATEAIGKHFGFFEKDNEQGKPNLVMPEIRVYTDTPPLSNSEKDVEL